MREFSFVQSSSVYDRSLIEDLRRRGLRRGRQLRHRSARYGPRLPRLLASHWPAAVRGSSVMFDVFYNQTRRYMQLAAVGSFAVALLAAGAAQAQTTITAGMVAHGPPQW